MLQLKKCCLCLPLKSGCYIISAIYLLFGSLLFFRELVDAFYRFYYLQQDGIAIGVVFVNDLTVTSLLLFSIFLFYGTYKEKPYFVFSGVALSISLLSINSFSLFLFFLDELVNLFKYEPPNPEQLIEQFVATVFMAYFSVVIWSHHKEMSSKDKRGSTFRNLGSNRDGFNQLDTETN